MDYESIGTFTCARCRLLQPGIAALVTARDNLICESCAPHYSQCSHCYGTFRNCDLRDRNSNNLRLCYNCVELYSYCDNCGDIYFTDDGADGYCTYCDENTGRCDDCGNRVDSDRLNSDGFCRDCARNNAGVYKRATVPYYDGPPSTLFPSTRRVGVELEMLVPDDMDSDEVPTRWGSTKEDGSLDPSWGEYGVEFASIPVSGSAISTMITAACSAFSSARVDESCGMHVHVDVRDLTNDQRTNIIKWFQHTEKQWFGIVNPNREDNSYCKPISDVAINRMDHDRYRALNTDAYGKHGTFEFRLHHGTINKQEIEQFVATAVNFIETAKDLPEPIPVVDNPRTVFLNMFAHPTFSASLTRLLDAAGR